MCAAVAIGALALSRAHAVTTIWDGGGINSNWDVATNWVGDIVPPAANDVQFASGFASGSTIQTNGNRTANSLIINTTSGFTLTGAAANILTLTSGNITRNDIAGTENNQFIGLDIALGANGTWSIAGAGALQMDAPIIGAGRSLTKSNGGTLILAGASTYSGGTSITGGILQLNSNSGAGSGAITIANSAQLDLNNVTIANNITVNGGGLAGTGAIRQLALAATLNGTLTLGSNSIINNAGTFDINGVVGDGAGTFNLTKTGAGVLRLNAANTYGGATNINTGVIRISNDNALGAGSVTVASGAALWLAAVNVNRALSIAGIGGSGALVAESGASSWSGPLTLTGNTAIGVNAAAGTSLNISGAIGGPFGLTKYGDGPLTLSGANSYSGPTNIAAGQLNIASNAAINNSSSISVQSGAGVELQGTGLNISPGLAISGSGVGGNGALRNTGAGSSTWAGSVTSPSGFTIGGNGSLNLTGTITATSASITKIGLGHLSLTNAANSFADLNINGGTLDINGEAGIPASSVITIADGATALLGGSATINRAITLNGSGIFGALGSITGAATWAGPVKLTSDATIHAGGTMTISGGIDGVGQALGKEGGGRLTLSGVNAFATAQVNEGILTLTAAAARPASSVIVAGGAGFELSGTGAINSTSLTISGFGAALAPGALRAVGANSTWGGSVTLQADSSVLVDAATQLTLSGSISSSGPFTLTKLGPGTLILSGFSSNSTAGTIISEGTVSVSDDDRLGGSGAPVIINGGKLLFTGSVFTSRDYNLTNGRLQTTGTTTLGGHVRGGFMLGPGTFSTGGGATLSGVTSFAGSNISASGPTFLEAFINGGSFNTSAALSWDGGVNSSSGAITIQSNTLTTTAFTNDGIININNGGTLLNTGNTLTSGGGSRITINSGGTLNVSSNSLQLNGALLVNNGTITGTTFVNFLSLAKGAGVYGGIIVGDGGRFSPGNSPGTVTTGSTTWNSGGSYLVEIADALSDSGHDFWLVDGQLNLNASSQHPFTISLASLDGLIFDPTRDYSFSVVHAAGGIVDFDPSAVILDLSAFKSSLGSGHFWLHSTSTDLTVNFAAVPEPAAMAALLAGILLMKRHRRRCPFCSQGEVT